MRLGSGLGGRIGTAGAVALLAASWLLVGATPQARAATVLLEGEVAADTGAPVELSQGAVLIVTLFDQTATADAGSILGQQRIDDVGALPIQFAVAYDDARIDPTHSYGVLASVVDGNTTWASPMPTPVITGGPARNVELTVEPAQDRPAAITGTIEPPAGAKLTKAAVAIAVLIKEGPGTLVDVETVTQIGGGPIPFSLGYDPELVDPEARYVVRAGIVDGGTVWGTAEPADAIVDGAPASNLSLSLVQRPEGIPPSPTGPVTAPSESAGAGGAEGSPVPSGAFQTIEPLPTGPLLPTRQPQPSAEPVPTAEATPAPVPTERPTLPPRPTEVPTPTPLPPTPTAAPTAPPTATPPPPPTPAPTAPPVPTPVPTPVVTPAPPTAVPTPSPTPTAAPTATPAVTPTALPPTATAPTGVLTVTGTLTYREPATLSADARAIVVLVEGAGRATAGSMVASTVIVAPGQVPISFQLSYANADIDPNITYSIAATIVDGDRTWVTNGGTPVITKGNPTSGVELKLVYIADVLKGAVSGTITGVDIELGAEAFSAAVLVDLSSDTRIGIDIQPSPTGVPIPFTVPFDPATINPATSYVVTAAIVDDPERWTNPAGVPVITNGNPLTDVTVPVASILPPSNEDALRAPLIVVLLLGLAAIGIVAYMRSRSRTALEPAALPAETAIAMSTQPPPAGAPTDSKPGAGASTGDSAAPDKEPSADDE